MSLTLTPLVWGRTLSGKMTHLVPAGSRNLDVKAMCGLRIVPWWAPASGKHCPKCIAKCGHFDVSRPTADRPTFACNVCGKEFE
jgi:hypothetical protein